MTTIPDRVFENIWDSRRLSNKPSERDNVESFRKLGLYC